MKIYNDPIFNFTEIFNEKNGMLIRTNILNEKGQETNKEPYMRSFPDLIDIGIMGKCHVNQLYCKKFGVDCYQSKNNHSDMLLSDYKTIINQCKGKTFQVALGGRGDPNKHKNFKEILKYTLDNGIIPNLTTSGMGMTDNEITLIKKYCGAVAVSMYSKVIINEFGIKESNEQTIEIINKLVSKNIITNIHYVISNETLDDIIFRLENNIFPKGINAIIFLLYKPVGIGLKEKQIIVNDEKFVKFMNIIKNIKFPFKIGFDTCFSPIIVKYLDNIDSKTIDYCEASRFSCYISPEMIMYPCSFIQDKKYGINLKKETILNAWWSSEFRQFKKLNSSKFKGCCPCKLNCLSSKIKVSVDCPKKTC